MTDANTIAAHYIDVWNETDIETRQNLLACHWTADATYVDPMMQGNNPSEIAALIGAAHERFPGFRFALDGKADGYGDNIRFSWRLGPPADPDMIRGTDFTVIQAGRIKQVIGFLDKLPAAG